MNSGKAKSVVIIGAGPTGLAAAAHALERGIEPVVLEAGDRPGHAVRQWQHVRMFSPWKYNIDRAAQKLLSETGWNAPDPEHYPTGAELLTQYIDPLVSRTRLESHIQTQARVEAVARVGFDKLKSSGREAAQFEVRYRNGGSSHSTLRADAVIDASGTWDTPNPAGANGLPAAGERENAARISYGMPDVLGAARRRYSGRKVAVLGSGHSAIGTLLDLSALVDEAPGTEVTWLLRGADPEKSFGGGANDKLAARGQLGAAFAGIVRKGEIRVETEFRLSQISGADDKLRLSTSSACCGRVVVVDELIVATGFRPDMGFLREVRTSFDPALECPPDLAPLIDPNVHSCGTVRPHGARELAQPDRGLYIAGMKSYGRAPTFLMVTGYEQVRSIVAELVGDSEGAERVELELPETGVCSRTVVEGGPQADGCCAAPAAEVSSCCS